MKETYEEVTMEIIRFEGEEVIITSGGTCPEEGPEFPF